MSTLFFGTSVRDVQPPDGAAGQRAPRETGALMSASKGTMAGPKPGARPANSLQGGRRIAVRRGREIAGITAMLTRLSEHGAPGSL